MKKQRTFTQSILLLCLFLSSPLSAEDLLRLYEIAYCNDPLLEVAKQDQLATRENVPQAGAAAFLPVVSAQVSNLQNNTSVPVTNPVPGFGSSSTDYFSNTYYITLQQPIYHFDFWAKYVQAIEQVNASNYRYAAAEQDLIFRLGQAYFNVLKARDSVCFTRMLVESFEKFVNQSNERYKAGLIAITDVNIARARHDNAVSQAIAAENNLVIQEQLLQEIICIPVCDLAPLKEELPLVCPDSTVENWVSKSLQQNLLLQATCFDANAAKANIKVSRADHFPNVNFIAEYNINDPGQIQPNGFAYTVRNNASYFGLQVNIPMFNGGATSSKVRQSVHNYYKAEGQYTRQYRLVESTARQSYQGIITQIEQISALKQAVASNEAALRATSEAFNVGTRSIVDVLNSENDLIRSKTDLANARYEYIIQTMKLKQAAGMLCPSDIERINTWLVHC